MNQENTRRAGRSVALSGAIGFVLAALLVGILIGGFISLFVIAPQLYANHQGTNDQGTSGSQNNNYPNGNNQNSYNNQGPTNNSYGNNQNGYNNWPTSSPGGNNQSNNYQNDSGSQGLSNSNPPITNPTGQYSSTSSQFSVTAVQNSVSVSGTIWANVNCSVQQNGGTIQLDVTVTPTSVSQSLSQIVDYSPVTFNFAGTTSGSQINAQAQGTAGSDPTSPYFSLNISGTITSSALTITVTPASNSQLSISTLQPITLQSS